MASPQLENGFTRIANELLEAITLAPLTKHEVKVVLAVMRETYGWSRPTAISLTAYRLARITGLQRTEASRVKKDLIARNILIDGPNGIGIQKDYERWLTAIGNNMFSRCESHPVRIGSGTNRTGSKSHRKPECESDRVVGYESHPLKEKENNQRNPDKRNPVVVKSCKATNGTAPPNLSPRPQPSRPPISEAWAGRASGEVDL